MNVRFGIIGLGNIGKVHVENFASGKIQGAALTAAVSPSEPRLALPAGVRHFSTVDALLDSGSIDAVLVATPHPSHREIGENVLSRGLHLLMEKPLAATKKDAEQLLAAPRRPGQQFGLMMNVRTHPQFQRLKRMIGAGELGELQRVQWTITNWFRPEAYYASSHWRATWRGEGGGVLINQALHNLDIWQWLCGMPSALRAFCRFGREHDIEVEDDVVAYLEYKNGATGLFITSTGEAPGVNRLEIAGTKGLALLEKDVLTVVRNQTDVRTYSRSTDNAFGMPGTDVETYPNNEPNPSHAGVTNNFVAAIRDGAPLLAPAEEGVHAVELANAMVYSTWEDKRVSLPLDAAAYQSALERAIATAKPRERVIRAAKVDMGKSYA